MPGEIHHHWVGTTLMIESDAGISGCDLRGRTGDIGPRGAQGPAGILYDENGNIVIQGYATEQYVNDLLANADLKPDLTGYATQAYVNNKITYSREDIEEGVTPLATGALYLVYE